MITPNRAAGPISQNTTAEEAVSRSCDADANCGLVVQPDACAFGRHVEVLAWLHERLSVRSQRWIAPFGRPELEQLYPNTGPWNSGWEIKLAMLRMGPSLLVEIPAEQWSTFVRVKGPSNPWLAAPGTLRTDLDACGTVLGLVHGADSVEAAQADLVRLSRRVTELGATELGDIRAHSGAPSFLRTLGHVVERLGGSASEPYRRAAELPRGQARFDAMIGALDSRRREMPECPLANWRTWGEQTAHLVRDRLAPCGERLDAWSDVVLSAGLHFFHRERRHVTP